MQKFFTVLGGIGAVAFAIVSLPLVLQCFQDGNADSVSIGYLVLSVIGNLCSFSYVLWTNIKNKVYQIPLYLNYSCATLIIFCLIVLKVIM